MLAEIAAERQGRVIALAWHVDYWDGLGWRDPFGDPRHTQRQRDYAGALALRAAYTPQMVVNGTEELVGSNRVRAQSAIAAALERRSAVAVSLTAAPGPSRPGEVALDWRVRRAPDGARLVLALVESGLASDVRRGENEGLRLEHARVVRAFETVRLAGPDTEGRATLRPAAPVALDRAAAVAFVEDAVSLRVLGAGEAAIAGPAPEGR